MNLKLTISSPSRLHFGFVELDKEASRNFGSLGLTISKFKNIIQIKESKNFQVIAKKQEIRSKIKGIFKKFSKKFLIKPFKIEVHETAPLHIGLGSGTQLSLAVGLLISEYNNLKLSFEDIVKISERGLRSGIGIESFRTGGFIVDCGKGKNTSIPPVFFKSKWPSNWKIILILDNSFKGLSGNEEKKQFIKISKVDSNISRNNSKTLLMDIIPSIIEGDFNNFCEGIQKIQDNMSKVFYNNKRKFASKTIQEVFNFIRKKNIKGYGQSSWGPSGFILCKDAKKRNELLIDLNKYMKYSNINNLIMEKIEGRNSGYIKTK